MSQKDLFGEHSLVVLCLVATGASAFGAALTILLQQRPKSSNTHTTTAKSPIVQVNEDPETLLRSIPPIRDGVAGLIGNTPMVKIHSLSAATGCTVLAKLEMQNPGGSAKDRVALAIIDTAEARGLIRPHSGDMIFEGTSGSTGISLAMLCRAKGYTAHIALPDDTSIEKVELLENLGAVVYKVRPASIIDDKQYVNYARKAAQAINDKADEAILNGSKKLPRALFADQFENEANWKAHFTHTGPEILAQTSGALDVFVTGAGTGGTISGVAKYLKSALSGNVRIVLADPQGSGFFNKIKFNVMFSPTEKEGTRRRHQVDTLVEGIGLNRVTQNFNVGAQYIDDAVKVSDTEALKMAKWLVREDGLFVGSSSAVHCVGAYRCAKALGPGHTVVTIICDSGARHLSKFWKAAEGVSISSLEEL